MGKRREAITKRLRRAGDLPGLARTLNTRRNPGSGSEAGLTLIELLVAMTVLGISLLGLAQLMSVSITMNDFSRFNTVGINVARGKLAELRAGFDYELRYDTAFSDLTVGQHGPETVTLPAPTDHQAAPAFAVSWTVSGLESGRKEIVIIVEPNTGVSEEGLFTRRITMRSRFAP